MGQIGMQIEQALKEAMRARRREEVNVLKMVRTELQYAAKEKQRDLTEEEEIRILTRMIRKRQEALEMYRAGGRTDRQAEEAREIAIIERFLPRKLGREDVLPIIEEVIREVGAQGPRDFGKVMGAVMRRLRGQRVDGAEVRAWVEERLSRGNA